MSQPVTVSEAQGQLLDDFRRATMTDLLSAGVDVLAARKLAGHADITTTARYDRRDESAKRRAVQSLNLPTAA